ncbi:hypothetical protein ACNTMW_19830 [Planosporangium sp. 12N6]|uniref:hypothetical protein n=1 Tax=Planosporangium spinosum TaxID=3402278 RepID=UPI003CEF0E20
MLAAGTLLGLALLTGCGSEGTDTSCGLDACTVTFDRGVDASAKVLGVEAKLVATNGNTVTVEVAGEQLQLAVGQPAVDAGAFSVSLDSLTDSAAVVRIARN